MAGVEQSGELLSAGYQGVVYKIVAGPEYPGTDYLIVKQPMGSPLVRWFRRRMIRREHRVYMRLTGIEGIPKCFGLKDGDQLLLEFIEGHPLKLSIGELEDREKFFAALLKLLQAAHRAGVARVILPSRNRDDVDEVPDEVREALDLCYVDETREALRVALPEDA